MPWLMRRSRSLASSYSRLQASRLRRLCSGSAEGRRYSPLSSGQLATCRLRWPTRFEARAGCLSVALGRPDVLVRNCCLLLCWMIAQGLGLLLALIQHFPSRLRPSVSLLTLPFWIFFVLACPGASGCRTQVLGLHRYGEASHPGPPCCFFSGSQTLLTSRIWSTLGQVFGCPARPSFPASPRRPLRFGFKHWDGRCSARFWSTCCLESKQHMGWSGQVSALPRTGPLAHSMLPGLLAFTNSAAHNLRNMLLNRCRLRQPQCMDLRQEARTTMLCSRQTNCWLQSLRSWCWDDQVRA